MVHTFGMTIGSLKIILKYLEQLNFRKNIPQAPKPLQTAPFLALENLYMKSMILTSAFTPLHFRSTTSNMSEKKTEQVFW